MRDAARERADRLEPLRAQAAALGLAALGDVLADADHAADGAVGVAARARVEQDEHRASVLGDERELEVRRLDALEREIEDLAHGVLVLGREVLAEAAAEHLVLGVAGELLGAAVPLVHAVVDVLAEDRRVRRLDQLAEVGCRGFGRVLGEASVVDVDPRADQFVRLPVLVACEDERIAHPAVAAVGMAEPVVVAHAAPREDVGDLLQHALEVGGMHAVDPERRRLEERRRGVAEQRLDVAADEGRAVVAAQLAGVDDGGARRDQVVQALLAAAEVGGAGLDQPLEVLVHQLQVALGAEALLVLEEEQHERGDGRHELLFVVGPAARLGGVLAAEDARDLVADADRRVEQRGDAVRAQVRLREARGRQVRARIVGADGQVALDRLEIRAVHRTQQRLARAALGLAVGEEMLAHDALAPLVEEPDAHARDGERLRCLARGELEEVLAVAAGVGAQDREHRVEQPALLAEPRERSLLTARRGDLAKDPARRHGHAVLEAHRDAPLEMHGLALPGAEHDLHRPDVLARREPAEVVAAVVLALEVDDLEDVHVRRLGLGVAEPLAPRAVDEADASVGRDALREVAHAVEEVALVHAVEGELRAGGLGRHRGKGPAGPEHLRVHLMCMRVGASRRG